MINVVAIDDEPLALQLITGYINKTPGIRLSGTFDNPTSASEYIEQNEIDLVFLDIQMPDLSGIQFAHLLEGRSKIVFTTAYEKYALEGYKLDAVDYLLKPFSYEEFLGSVKKAVKLINLEKADKARVKANNDYLFIKSEYRIKRINFRDILYIEGLKDYVKIITMTHPKPILSIISLKLLETKLPEKTFMRVHRSFIVNLNRIDTIERSRIVFGKVYIPIGDQYKDRFQSYLNLNFL